MPKIKMMSDYTIKKLDMNSREDQENIEAIKNKLQSIDQNEQKNRAAEKGLGNFVVELV